MWENLDTNSSVSCIFCHYEEPAASVVDSMEESSDECWDSNYDVSDTVTFPTPERPVAIKVSRTTITQFVESINKAQRCVTPHCVGELKFNSRSLSYACSVYTVQYLKPL